MKKRVFFAAAGLVAAVLAFGPESAFARGTKAGTGNVVNIAGSGSPKPYQYLDDKGQLLGYDVEVANEIAKRIGVTLHWEQTEFPGLFLGLDANKYQIVANNLSKTEARAAKYVYGEEYYLRNRDIIVVKKGTTGIRAVDDLVGKKVPTIPEGNTYSLFLQKYNEEHPNAKIDIVFTEANAVEQINGVALGQFDALIVERIIADQVIKETGAELDLVDIPEETAETIAPAKSYFLFSQSGAALRGKWDAALREMIADGTLKALSLKYFDYDYSR
ncbi:MAG: transporter substrate-binding domain-containing protein [Spirochaetaceae bacterium]|jgi:ABC-type amino acid transport substrate-binding protein|nr:transporter substrate-binding domain-containing protein [Spirochaetaceae bacterium]